MSLQIVVQDCDMSHYLHAGGEVVRNARVFTIEAPELEAFLRQHRDAQAKAQEKRSGWPDFTRQVISVEPTP